ncbi:hypothetical protein L1049_019652 [Liquidambar formosana]|uniref:RING-type E3 ubiquitin transferase n=1 Tax=Liquidambar formosana TaxID=63359 RepID=A0AAP0S8J5_LIQFO
MGSVVEETEEERLVDVENTIFVAVGKDSQSTLGWAVQNFAGKKICLLHVHRPTHLAAFMNGKLSANKLNQHAVKAFWELDRQKMHKLLNQYLLILAQAGVQADKVWIETDNIEKGIIEIIAQHNIRWLVMGAAADDYYSKNMSEIKSKKAIFVCQQAPVSCHIWFSCKGCLIYTRGCGKDKTEIGITPPLLLLNSDIGTEQSEYFSSESVLNRQRSLNCARAKDANEWEGTIKRFSSQLSAAFNLALQTTCLAV